VEEELDEAEVVVVEQMIERIAELKDLQEGVAVDLKEEGEEQEIQELYLSFLNSFL